uniref:Iron transporter n=1 Tax=Desulfatirhabdium butyrativorans TaxID=340467 RepID=A0A7C4VZC7_9BACT
MSDIQAKSDPAPPKVETRYTIFSIPAERWAAGFREGIHKGWSGFVWLLQMLIPISFLTALLQYSGWLHRLDTLIAPIMGWIGLPGAAALPIIVGMLTGVYGGIAAMILLPFSPHQMTLIAIFVLISHNLIQESVIQARSGFTAMKAAVFRILASLITVALVSRWMGNEAGGPSVAADAGAFQSQSVSLMNYLMDWALSMTQLSIKILIIIMGLMIVLGLLKSFDWIPALVRILRPFLRLMGLSERVGVLWLTAVVFGLTYGAAVIVEEAREGNLSAADLEKLHLSVGINHSMVEDPILFVALGLNAFWLYVPRLVTAIAAVRLWGVWLRIKGG